MFELNIDVSVKLHTGATITLTEEQVKRIKSNVIEVVLGSTTTTTTTTDVKATRKYKSTKVRAWEDSEAKLVDELVAKYSYVPRNTNNKTRAAELKELAKLLKRKTASVMSMYYQRNSERMAREKMAKQLTDPKWTPVTINK